ncbi:hypothetical protein Tco_0874974 [Tanacetum coccineum]|uniref:Uncharacterized protein n=1 Tax=Tanacetum coccineum TaxID=301880 RepID=A0ABQ5BNY1_9ASTR
MSRDHLLSGKREGCSNVFTTFSVARISLGLLDKLESSPWLDPQYEKNMSSPSTFVGGWKVCGEKLYQVSCSQPMSNPEIRWSLCKPKICKVSSVYLVMKALVLLPFLCLKLCTARSPYEKAFLACLEEDNLQSTEQTGSRS